MKGNKVDTELKFGSNTPQVNLFLERINVLTLEEIKTSMARGTALNAALNIARKTARQIARAMARNAAWNTARNAALDTTWNAAWYAAQVDAQDSAWSAGDVATAIVVMDLISEEHFKILTEPFAEILTELGIIWTPTTETK